MGTITFDPDDLAATRTALGLTIGTDVLAPNGSGANLTNLPDLSSDIRALALQSASDRIGLEDGIADPFTDETDVSLYVQTDGTTIGDLHSSNHGGIEAVFNGTSDAAASSSGSKASATNFYVGKQFSSAEVVTGFSVTGSNNVGFYSPNDSATITATLYGKNGTPSSGTDGTVIGLAQSGTDANSLTLSQSGNGNTTAYTHVWVYVSHGDSADSMYCTDLRFTLSSKSSDASFDSSGTFYSPALAVGSAVDLSSKSYFGNMTGDGGVAAAFDGTTSQTYQNSASGGSSPGTVGVALGSGNGFTLTQAKFYAPNNTGANVNTSVKIYGNSSASATGGTLLHTGAIGSSTSDTATYSISNTTSYENYYAELAFSAGTAYIAELQLFSGSMQNMTLVSNAFTADSAPSNAIVGVQVVENESITANTDLTAEVSRDGGSNFTTCTLVLNTTLGATSTKYYESASTSISSQPSGTSMVYRIKTLNNKNIEVHGVALKWS